MKENTKCYWEKRYQKQTIAILTRTVVHPFLDIFVVKYVQDILRSFCNKNQAHQVLQRYYVCITDSDHDYILDEILRQDQIEYERKIKIEDYTD